MALTYTSPSLCLYVSLSLSLSIFSLLSLSSHLFPSPFPSLSPPLLCIAEHIRHRHNPGRLIGTPLNTSPVPGPIPRNTPKRWPSQSTTSHRKQRRYPPPRALPQALGRRRRQRTLRKHSSSYARQQGTPPRRELPPHRGWRICASIAEALFTDGSRSAARNGQGGGHV